MNTLEREVVRLTAMLAAAEKWAPGYSDAPEQHGQLILAEAELQLVLTKYFKNMQSKARNFVNWDMYHFHARYNQKTALGKDKLDYNIDVIVNDEQIDNIKDRNSFIQITLSTVEKATVAGLNAAEIRSNLPPLGIPGVNKIIKNLSTKQVANLVGMKVLPDDTIIKNPNASMNILATVRKDIANSVKTSLDKGETTDQAVERMQEIISPFDRAELIAQTESVNAYNAGVMEFGQQSDAVGKEWEDAGADDVCAENTSQGPILIDDDFVSGDPEPTAHPRCRCGMRLIYQEEWDATNGGANPYEVDTGITPA